MINVFQPALGIEELSAVRQVFDSNWVGKGARTDQFESCFAEHKFIFSTDFSTISLCSCFS